MAEIYSLQFVDIEENFQLIEEKDGKILRDT